ncbi:MAG: class I SAM-dependent methyltransferase, partial [Melioribacteraceae bacterium]
SKFFSNIQEKKWYYQFLTPVVNKIERDTKLLDIGTGSGKLVQILSNEKNVSCFGVDTSQAMLDEAAIKLKNTGVKLIKIEPNEVLPFENNLFDYVTICNVLFHLDKNSVYYLLDEARRVLKNNGKIIVLTPTGYGNFFKLTKNFLSLNNLSIYIWYYATKNRAGPWSINKFLFKYCNNNKMKYKQTITFKGFAQVETIRKL